MATEKRLIDANAADVERISCYYGDHCYIEDVQEWLNEQPTVDAVEVVRCKDCKYYHADTLSCDFTPHSKYYERPNWYEDDYCSYGERKGNV